MFHLDHIHTFTARQNHNNADFKHKMPITSPPITILFAAISRYVLPNPDGRKQTLPIALKKSYCVMRSNEFETSHKYKCIIMTEYIYNRLTSNFTFCKRLFLPLYFLTFHILNHIILIHPRSQRSPWHSWSL